MKRFIAQATTAAMGKGPRQGCAPHMPHARAPRSTRTHTHAYVRTHHTAKKGSSCRGTSTAGPFCRAPANRRLLLVVPDCSAEVRTHARARPARPARTRPHAPTNPPTHPPSAHRGRGGHLAHRLRIHGIKGPHDHFGKITIQPWEWHEFGNPTPSYAGPVCRFGFGRLHQTFSGARGRCRLDAC